MLAAFLPGGRRVDLAEVADPRPGHGQVVLAMKASTICGSDLRAIYREHLGEGPEAYQGVIGGHEPAGEVIEVGPGVTHLSPGDRVVVYHISGCGVCDDCREGYQISCTGEARAAYGWQRDGGHADRLLADARDCVVLPDSMTFLDGACVACGFGTAYEALRRLDVNGRDELLITGLGPVGLAAGLLAGRMGVRSIVGTDVSPERRQRAMDLGAVTRAVAADDEEGLDEALPRGASAAFDASGSGQAQHQAIARSRRWGRVALVGEGGRLDIDVSEHIIHKQLTIHGSWVTSTLHMAELLRDLDAWGLHPEVIVSERFPLERAADAYAAADSGRLGKVAVVW
ncbi:alcohol dehydrogenase [Tessaracoccus aquimaris]|uniref:Alcohol dehydrogenase n=1 Tax=Tessaracoccus aquimaris TaxID=1332264 RepID=A0A1Q2CKV9_9ACTN|nr:zinc-binding dehydrogenase [Tessaracoccus aquimaris]AQP46739.1 alcohol dehydrogenase [Tessaracoccus aquimaris]